MANLEFLSEEENKQRDQIIRDLNNAFQQQNQTYTELDDMNYPAWYVANKKAATGYMRPKKNPEDIRVVTGTTREKCNTVVTALLRYNFDFEIATFDEKDWPDRDLGYGLEGLVRKSREMEEPSFDSKLPLFYTEFVAQGNLFLYETMNEYMEIVKTMNGDIKNVFKAKWSSKPIKKRRCEVNMVPGLNVYLGNIREYYMRKQPFVGLRRELTEEAAEQLYGDNPRWEMAEAAKNKVLNDKGGQEYNNFQMLRTEKGFKEEVIYMNLPDNSLQVMLDGVPMLPVGFPLEYLLGVRDYPLIKVDAENLGPYFAYSRGIATKNKFNQAMVDEMYRIIVLKFRKSTTPSMANLTGKMLNKSIFQPGTIHQGIDSEKLKPIGENSPMTGPEFDTFQLVKQAIDEASVSPVLEGNRTPGQQTAQEINTLKTQSLQKLGMIMIGLMQMHKQLVWLRACNYAKNMTSPVDTELSEIQGKIKKIPVYPSVSVNSKFQDGQSGIHMIEMTTQDSMPTAHQVKAEEDLLSRQKGVKVRKTYIDAEILGSLKHTFYVKVFPTEKDHSEMQAVLFEESMTKAFELFPDTVNKPYFQEEWANHKKLDPQKAFVTPQQAPMGGGAMPNLGMGQNLVMGAGGPMVSRGTTLTMTPGARPGPVTKTVGAQALPQVKQQIKPGLKRML